jgi:pimeloyl-ACP methyl ester carboxylesterase
MNLFLEINGGSLFLEICGPEGGPAVVLLHHGLGSVQAWKEQIPALAEAGFRAIAYDRRGYGQSSPRRMGYFQPLFTSEREDLHTLLGALGIERAALVGHSDGGTIALYYAADHPEQTTHVVTAAAHIYVEEKMEAGIDGVREAYETGERFREGLRKVHGEQAGAVFEGWYSGWRRPETLDWDMRPLLGKIACPTLVVQGMEDEHATPQHARELAASIPKAELWLEPGAGHMLPQERAGLFNERVVEFLRRKTMDEGRKI